MAQLKFTYFRLSDSDLNFLVETVAPGVTDQSHLKRIINEDEDFSNTFISDEKVWRQLMDDDEILLKISPPLFFEILLRKAINDLSKQSYTIEKTSTMRIPIFDAEDIIALLNQKSFIGYLAHMLSSFTRIESYMVSLRIEKGIWQKIRFNDLDIVSLKKLCEAVDDEHRFALYKRIADACLFILGIFPDYAEHNTRHLFSGKVRVKISGKANMGPEDYEKEGQKFYKLAAEHESAIKLDLSEIFWSLHENFQKVKKPLNFIAEHYLQYKRQHLFG